MTDELIDIYDENNNHLNIQKMKSEAHKKGLWHRSSHIWIYNSNKEILLQLRAKEKPLYPNMWDISAAGHVSAGEDPITSGIREIEEEIGLSVKEQDLNFWKIKKNQTIFKDIINKEFYYIYFLKFDGDIKQLKMQKEEVQNIKFVPIDKVRQDLRAHPEKYVPHGKYWSEVLDEINKRSN